MRAISAYKWNQMEYVVPNIQNFPGLSIDETNSKITYRYHNSILLEITKETDYSSELQYYVTGYDNTLAQELGLTILKVGTTGHDILEALYYKCTTIDFSKFTSSPENFFKFQEKLRLRLNKQYVTGNTKFTEQLINIWVTQIEQSNNITRPTRASTLQEIYNYTTLMRGYIGDAFLYAYRVCFCIKNLTWYPSHVTKQIKTRGSVYYYVRKDTTSLIDEFGLENSTSGCYYNPLTEVIYNNNIYLQTDLTLINCPTCGTQVLAHQIDDDTCPNCQETLGKIHNYTTRVPSLLKFKATKVKPSTLYLGAELEYESRGRDQKTKDAIFTNKVLKDHAILKSDGSINNGFEIVTCPATLDIHLVEFKKFFAEFKDKTTLHKDNNTGMHIHISRSPLSMLTVGKMTAFLNNDANKKFIEQIAGRSLNHYCRIDTSRTVSFPLVNGRGDRYNTLNLNNDATVEIRIFSTPENYEEFAYKMEFADALANYCSPCTVGISVNEQIKSPAFINWVMTQKHSYPHLVNKIKSI
jgi:hypothetical protein